MSAESFMKIKPITNAKYLLLFSNAEIPTVKHGKSMINIATSHHLCKGTSEGVEL